MRPESANEPPGLAVRSLAGGDVYMSKAADEPILPEDMPLVSVRACGSQMHVSE